MFHSNMTQDYPTAQLPQPPPYIPSEFETQKVSRKKRRYFKLERNSCFVNTWENFPVTISVTVFVICLGLASGIVWIYYHPNIRSLEKVDPLSCPCVVASTRLTNSTSEIHNNTTFPDTSIKTAVMPVQDNSKKELEELKTSTEQLIAGLIEEHKLRESENVNDFMKERSNLIKVQQRRESQLVAYYVEQREALKEAYLQEIEEYKLKISELENEYGIQDTSTWSNESEDIQY